MKALTDDEKKFLMSLDTPQKIQEYLDTIPFNHEYNGETCMSPRQVIRKNKAHCLEGAFLACAALILQKRKPLIMSLKVTSNDYDHVVTLFEENGYYGAISKTNHAVLSWRDPVYKSVRELAMSYFHEYFLNNGEKTLRGYSLPCNMRRFGTKWITCETDLFSIGITISKLDHLPTVPRGNERFIRKATMLERTSAKESQDGK